MGGTPWRAGLQGFMGHVRGESSEPRKLSWVGRNPHINPIIKNKRELCPESKPLLGKGKKRHSWPGGRLCAPESPPDAVASPRVPPSGRVGRPGQKKARGSGRHRTWAAGSVPATRAQPSPSIRHCPRHLPHPVPPLRSPLRPLFSCSIFFFKHHLLSLPTKQKQEVLCNTILARSSRKLGHGRPPPPRGSRLFPKFE